MALHSRTNLFRLTGWTAAVTATIYIVSPLPPCWFCDGLY